MTPRRDRAPLAAYFGPQYADYFDVDPLLLIEIADEETGERDKVAKTLAYTTIPTIQTYLIVEQDERRIYAHQRGADGSWILRENAGKGEIPLPCLGRRLSLDEIYEGVR